MTVARAAALIIALLGCVADLRTRRLPNVLTFGAAGAGLIFALVTGGWPGMGWAALGWIAGAAVWFPFFVLRGVGAGDVKLLGALGVWIGPVAAIWLALWSAVAGGVLAIAVSLSHGYTKQAFANVWGLLTYWRVVGVRPHPGLTLESADGRVPRLPYAVPIAVGLVVTLWLK
jgi:prepilin peptidase CpaA